MYVQIACARNQRAKQLKVLTYSKNTSQKGTLTIMWIICRYINFMNQRTRLASPNSKSLMYFPENSVFGLASWHGKLQCGMFPSFAGPRKTEPYRCHMDWVGTWLWDFHRFSPSSLCINLWKKLRQPTSWSGCWMEVFLLLWSKYSETWTCFEKKKARFKCVVCSRTGAWGDRNKFLRSSSCAGYRETPKQALSRARLEIASKKCMSQAPLPSPHLCEKEQVFSDMIGSIVQSLDILLAFMVIEFWLVVLWQL